MKRIISLVIMLAITLSMLVGCCTDKKENEKFMIYASIYPLYDFASKIGGDKAEVNLIIPTGIEPHDWEPTAKDIVNLSSADLFIYNGAHLEHWVEDVEGTLKNENVTILCATDNVAKLKNNGEDDPHVWLDPISAIIELEAIKDAFVECDSKNADYYTENLHYYTHAI